MLISIVGVTNLLADVSYSIQIELVNVSSVVGHAIVHSHHQDGGVQAGMGLTQGKWLAGKS